MEYIYSARNSLGELIEGKLEAHNETEVSTYLKQQQIIPIHIRESSDKRTSFFRRNKKVKTTDLIFFSRQMYTLFRAGVPILDALDSLKQSNPHSNLNPVINRIISHLDSGTDLSTALKREKDSFTPLFISIIELGETSGTLAEAFDSLSTYLDKEEATRNNIIAAIRYPIFVIATVAIAVTIINIVVIPAFSGFFSRYSTELPLPTRMLMNFSNFTTNYWYIILASIIASVFGIRKYVAKPSGRLIWDQYSLKLPVVGSILFNAALSRFARALSINLKAGVPWSVAMDVLIATVNNSYIEINLESIKSGVERGESLTNCAAETKLFPYMVLQMMQVGEQSGQLDTLLLDVAEYYEREVDYQIKNLSSSIEPILTIVMGILVLILALAIFLPMFDLASTVLGNR